MNIFSWMKNNWLLVVLGLVIFILLGKKSMPITYPMNQSLERADISVKSSASGIAMPYGISRAVAPTISDQRMVVQNTNMSMLVKDVSDTIKRIEKVATQTGGYMVDKSLTKPEGAASGRISLRIPAEKREDTLDEIRLLGVKVVSENVYGDDVTDQYVDTGTRIANLEKVKAKMELILDHAVRVQDLVEVQMQINNIQEQIDSLKGQQKYLEQTAKLTLISVNLSTDELALPYAPDAAWRPGVVFKEAVRSMIGALRGVGSAIIWLVVYLPVMLILLGVILLGRWTYRKYLIAEKMKVSN